MTKPRIAIIGSRGIPAAYGGFETFAEHLAPRLAADGYDVTVSCEGRAAPRPKTYKGVTLFYFPLKPFRRVLYETMYDVYALFRASILCDCVLMLGYGAGLFFWIPRLFRKRLAVNVDGLEYTRGKYNRVEKAALYVNELFALLFAHTIVADAWAVSTFLDRRGHAAVCIPYGVDVPAPVSWDPSLVPADRDGGKVDLTADGYYLMVARLERENNVHAIVEGFLTARTTRPLVVVGAFVDSEYEEKVRALVRQGNAEHKVLFVGSIYDHVTLTMLRQHCRAYVHGHSAGGTNPSLLEAMAARALIVAHDNPYNREVCGQHAFFFTNAATLARTLSTIEYSRQEEAQRFVLLRNGARDRVRQKYTWDGALHAYETVLTDLVDNKQRTHETPPR